ncbi:MAG: DEAD/DEAH box helicase [Planctomycetota bacterium]|jgi:ATP-dependent RNA helicase RhlE
MSEASGSEGLAFADLDLLEPILRAVEEQGYAQPTPIQQQAVPHLLTGRDLLGIAQTGTGKTAAFALPILDLLAGDPQPQVPNRPSVLVLTPTRELAAQIAESFRIYGQHLDLRHTVIFGGVGQNPQVKALKQGVDVLVATPGRLIDLMDQGHIDLRLIEVFVLDEADRMLDMGFIHDVRRVIAKLPKERQSLLFSATMPPDIVKLAHTILSDPVRVEVTPQATTVERIEQSVLLVEKSDKRELLGEVLRDQSIERVLVFTRTKHGADRVVKHLRRIGEEAQAIHGNKSQNARERALDSFRKGSLRVLVATDIAARGIDVPEITHVINFDLPNLPESYVHRIGRTARAGRGGIAISFCDVSEREYLEDIEKTIRQQVPILEDHPFRSKTPFTRRENTRPNKKKATRRGPRGRGRGRKAPRRTARRSA